MISLCAGGVGHTIGKLSTRATTLFGDFILIEGLYAKLWACKLVGVPVVKISVLPFGVLGQNAIWMWALWRGTKYIIRGKMVASPKSGPW